jgi:hypothetical protein
MKAVAITAAVCVVANVAMANEVMVTFMCKGWHGYYSAGGKLERWNNESTSLKLDMPSSLANYWERGIASGFTTGTGYGGTGRSSLWLVCSAF